jgi:Zn-dependent metalloprotease
MIRPPHTQIEYRNNGTPSYIKGRDLAAHLKATSDFQSALNKYDYEEMAVLFLGYYKSFFKLAAACNTLEVESIRSDGLGSTHVRFRQMLNQIPVWEKTVRVHFNHHQALYLFQGDYLPDALLENVGTVAKVTPSDASKIALESMSGSTGLWRVQNVSTMVYVTESREPRLAYGMILEKGLARRNHCIIDAIDGRILEKTSLIRY